MNIKTNYLSNTYVLFIAFILCTSQTCKQVLPTKCNDIEIFYGPSIETFGPTSDNNPNQQDRFYLADLYYRSSNQNFTGLKIEFKDSYFELVTNTNISVNSADPSIVQLTSNSPLPTTDGNSFSKLGTLAWRVKYLDFGTTVFGTQKFNFIDLNGQSFSICNPTFIEPPFQYAINGVNIQKPIGGYIPQ